MNTQIEETLVLVKPDGVARNLTGEILRRPRAGEECIVVAWPLLREGRKELAGVALFSAGGELMARAQQVWIVMQAQPASGVTPAAVSA